MINIVVQMKSGQAHKVRDIKYPNFRTFATQLTLTDGWLVFDTLAVALSEIESIWEDKNNDHE